MIVSIISASTRIERKSHRVALALEKTLKNTSDHEVQLLDLAAYRFPIFEEILAKHPNPPDGLADFSEQVRRSTAIIFVSPEYNGSYTSALKNAVDFLKDQEFAQKVVGVAAVTTGGGGGMRAALAMQQLALGAGGFVIPQMFLVPQVHLKFDEAGELLDEMFSKNVSNFLSKFLWLAEAVAAKKGD